MKTFHQSNYPRGCLEQHIYVLVKMVISRDSFLNELFPRVDPTANTATNTVFHRQLPPLGIAIMLNYMDIWQILREHIELTEEAKIEQLFFMMSEMSENQPFPMEQFKELLGALPVDKVD